MSDDEDININDRCLQFLKNKAWTGPSLKWNNGLIILLHGILLFVPISNFTSEKKSEKKDDILITELMNEEAATFILIAVSTLLLQLISLTLSITLCHLELSSRNILSLQVAMLVLNIISSSLMFEDIIFQAGSLDINSYFVYFICWFIPLWNLLICFRLTLAIMHTFHYYIKDRRFSVLNNENIALV